MAEIDDETREIWIANTRLLDAIRANPVLPFADSTTSEDSESTEISESTEDSETTEASGLIPTFGTLGFVRR
jgi:hypothetical protein